MQARHEHREYDKNIKVWVGRYKNLSNLPHWHSDHEIVYAEKGRATVHIANQTYSVEQGQAIFIQSESVHYIHSDGDSILLLFIFAQKPLQRVTDGFQLATPLLTKDYNFPALAEKLSSDMHPMTRLSPISALNRTERLLIDLFANEPTCAVDKKSGESENNFRRLLDDIDKNFANYTLANAAKFMSVSESHFSKLFKHMADTTFTRYLNMVRVEKAIEMMREGKNTITETAICCGFGSIRNFNRVFRDITGYAPRLLPADYNSFSVHPTYSSGNKDTFDPTDTSSVLL